ncbi:hypothetical protein B566_EDAN013713 [Ephemera danica]|nr:hypothetical protein B566_EDAN013713 [Ephemera danica]
MVYRNKSTIDIKQKLKENWLLPGILISIIIAQISPSIGVKGGLLRPEITVKYVCVAGIFFVSGLSLKSEQLFKAFKQYRLHTFIQGFTLFIFPLIVQIGVWFLRSVGLNEWIVKGLVTVSCMPPPVSSAVILTRAVGGNEAAAIFNSAFGSFLGIIVTPLTLLHFLGVSTLVPLLSTMVQLGTTVLLPLIAGQLARKVAAHWVRKNSTLVSNLMVVLQVFLLLAVFSLASRLKRWFSPSDVVAILFCSTHKSLTLGIPMLRILFGGYSHLSQITLPLLVYHPTQILLGSILAAPLRQPYSLGI